MEKVDSLINTLAEHIETLILTNKEYGNNEIAEKTKALAELISVSRGTYEEVKDSESEDKMEELEKLCIPVEEWMKRNESPYSMVCVTEGKIELFDTSICIPTKKAVD